MLLFLMFAQVLGSSTRVKQSGLKDKAEPIDGDRPPAGREESEPKTTTSAAATGFQKSTSESTLSFHDRSQGPDIGSMPSLPSSFSQGFHGIDSTVTLSRVSLDFAGSQMPSAVFGSQAGSNAASHTLFSSQSDFDAATSGQELTMSDVTDGVASHQTALSAVDQTSGQELRQKAAEHAHHSEQQQHRLDLLLKRGGVSSADMQGALGSAAELGKSGTSHTGVHGDVRGQTQ